MVQEGLDTSDPVLQREHDALENRMVAAMVNTFHP